MVQFPINTSPVYTADWTADGSGEQFQLLNLNAVPPAGADREVFKWRKLPAGATVTSFILPTDSELAVDPATPGDQYGVMVAWALGPIQVSPLSAEVVFIISP